MTSNGLVAILVAKRSEGVRTEVNMRIPLHGGNKAWKRRHQIGGVLVLLKFEVNSHKLEVQAPQNFEFEWEIAMLKC